MGKNTEVIRAVRQALSTDGKAVKTGQEKLGDDFGYTDESIILLLRRIYNYLKNDHPSYDFDFNSLDPGDCVAATVDAFGFMVALATKPA
jgi:hypothetical protein